MKVQFLRCLPLAVVLCAVSPVRSSQLSENPEARPPNVLFIAVDDLRPELGCYGSPWIQSPNIDHLAREGALFTRAYCQQATCNPSRISLLSGRRPDTSGIYDLHTHMRERLPDVISLPQHFKNHGYHVLGFGKIYHAGLNDEASWSEPVDLGWREGGMVTHLPVVPLEAPENLHRKLDPSKTKYKPSWVIVADEDEDKLSDSRVAAASIRALEDYADGSREEPLFLAVGFRKPHLAFWAPKRFYDLYPLESMPLVDNPHRPSNSPPFPTTTDSGELRTYSDIPPRGKGEVDANKGRELVRGYFASVSYIDFLVGKLLDQLDALDLAEDTIVVLWGDHGWHLGEHSQWGKHTNFEVATRVPLIFRYPGQSEKGAAISGVVELLDVFPTLVELAGLPVSVGVEGRSLVPLLENSTAPWDGAAVSQWPRPHMGYSLRTHHYRFTEWVPEKDTEAPPVGVELYDHRVDPKETVNLAAFPEHQSTLRELSARLREQTGRATLKWENRNF